MRTKVKRRIVISFDISGLIIAWAMFGTRYLPYFSWRSWLFTVLVVSWRGETSLNEWAVQPSGCRQPNIAAGLRETGLMVATAS